jgi:hypothetical protein
MGKRISILLVVLSSLAALGAAQAPTSGNVFIGYSYYNTDLSLNRGSLNGFEGSLEGKLIPWVGIAGDFSANYGSLPFPNPAATCPIGVVCGPLSASVHIDNLLFGPRVSISVAKIRPFAQALFGFAHASTHGFGSDTSFATALGGGLDYHLIPLVAWRFQGDYVRTYLFNTSQNNARFSTGIVIRF